MIKELKLRVQIVPRTVLPGSSSTSATTAGNQHPSNTGSCRLISACDGSILSSVPERTAGKNYWQVALRNLAQRRSESKLPLKTCVPWPNGGLDSGSASPP